MASITNISGGRKTIQFVGGDKKRRSIRLGKTTKKDANTFKLKVEALVSAKIMGHVPDDETCRWLAGLDNAMYEKLAAVELVLPRASARLEDWLALYIKSRDLKPASIGKLEQTKSKMLAFFSPATQLRHITTATAAEWRTWLGEQLNPTTKLPISIATVNTHCGNAKTFFAEAVRRELVSRNPFDYLSSGRVAAKTHYVDVETIEKVIDACPDSEWRLLFGVTRYAGLRCPSETHLLTWADVDWDRQRLFVRSPKTERHAGKESRVVPICPRLMELLQERFDAADEGERHLISQKGKGAVQRQVRAICQRAGVQLWPRLWQSLRSSCEKWWAMEYPQYAVSHWIGHSIEISGKHYANSVPDELYEKVSNSTVNKAVQNPVQSGAEMGCNEPQSKNAASRESANCGGLQSNAKYCNELINGAGGSRTPVP